MIFKTNIKVWGFHLDLYRHVNNARYLEFLEQARWEFTEQLGLMQSLHQKQLGFVIVNINIDYRSPAVLGDELEVQSRIKEFDAKKGIIKQVIVNGKTQKKVVEADVTYVILDLKTQKIGQLDDELVNKFIQLVENN